MRLRAYPRLERENVLPGIVRIGVEIADVGRVAVAAAEVVAAGVDRAAAVDVAATVAVVTVDRGTRKASHGFSRIT